MIILLNILMMHKESMKLFISLDITVFTFEVLSDTTFQQMLCTAVRTSIFMQE